MNYFFIYDTAGKIYGAPYLGDANEWTNIPLGYSVLGPIDEANNEATDAYLHPDRYLIQNEQFVIQPYLTLDVVKSGNQYTLTAMVNNADVASVDFLIADATFNTSVTNNQASIIVNVDDVVADQNIPIQVSSVGVVSASLSIGGLKPFTPNRIAKLDANGNVVVKCTSRKEIKEHGLTINVPEEDREADEANMLDLLADGVFKLLQWAQNPTYAPLSLTADEQNTITDFVTNYKFRLQLHDANPLQGSATQQNPRYPLLLGDKPKANDAADKIRSRLFDSDTINP